jgi:hypothetical protein
LPAGCPIAAVISEKWSPFILLKLVAAVGLEPTTYGL